MKKIAAILFCTLLGVSATAGAVAFNFDVTYFGGNVASLDGGSDNPVGADIQPGDTFDWNIHASGAGYWEVINGNSFFPFMAFPVGPGGTRTGDFTLNLYLDGVSVFTQTQIGANNSSVHLGTNAIALGAGLQFDEMELLYALTASGTANTVPTSILGWPVGQAPELTFAGDIVFAAVPEPGTLALLLMGLAGLGFAPRSSRRS